MNRNITIVLSNNNNNIVKLSIDEDPYDDHGWLKFNGVDNDGLDFEAAFSPGSISHYYITPK